MKTVSFPVSRRNLVSLALRLKGGGTKRHGKTVKAERRMAKVLLQREAL